MKYFLLLAIFAVTIFMSSCATILTGTTQRVTIDSSPQGANIIVDGRMVGTTPARVRVNRDLNDFIDDGKDIQLVLDGYYSDGYYLGTDIEPMIILNVIFPFGFAFDAVTGAAVRYDSDYYRFLLAPRDDVPIPTAPSQTAAQNNIDEPVIDDYEKLMNLIEQYEEGLLSEEEFEAAKAQIFKEKRMQ